MTAPPPLKRSTARLRILTGKSMSKLIPLELGTEYSVGTSRRSDVRLRDQGVGFHHAELIPDGMSFRLHDHHSTTGTFVGDLRLERRSDKLLEHGDLIRFGPVEARFEQGLIEEPPPEGGDGAPS